MFDLKGAGDRAAEASGGEEEKCREEATQEGRRAGAEGR